MTSELEKAELEVACQQILERDASVYSVQWLELPERYAAQLGASLLLERYLKFIRARTWHLIRPTVSADGIQFRLLASSVALLSFAPPRYSALQDGEDVTLAISGGCLVQAGECDRGMFSLASARLEGRVRVTVQLSDYCPLLLGSGNPSVLRRLLYRFTQAYIHKVVTVKYLGALYRELTGQKACTKVKKVRVREGIDT